MFLKNYTSAAPISETIARIEKVLLKCQVTGIAKEYHPSGSGKIVALTFVIKFSDTLSRSIRLPVNEESALQALWLDYADGDTLTADGEKIASWGSRKTKRRADFKEQAERTAWKIMQDWIEVQMSMIQMKQAEFQEVFLPYIMVNENQTYYQQLRGQGFRALLPAPTNP